MLRTACCHLLFVALAFLWNAGYPLSARAEFTCSAEVSYSVKKKPVKKDEEPEEVKVPVKLLQSSNSQEKEAKAALEKEAIRARQETTTLCRRKHENLAGCIATKFSTMASVLQRLDFSARKALEDAIREDCTAVQGNCQPAVVSEVKCEETKAEEEGEDEDDKKKKKK